ncbi:cell wall-binding repeat-containing protein [Ornithinimicrobium sp. W1665]|uniref:cell wall-binding repeat-containing protein n=2 Tax=Ornithinimicrobium sp. W1665 TaxID=3416666 RepID=UPI003CF8DD21
MDVSVVRGRVRPRTSERFRARRTGGPPERANHHLLTHRHLLTYVGGALAVTLGVAVLQVGADPATVLAPGAVAAAGAALLPAVLAGTAARAAARRALGRRLPTAPAVRAALGLTLLAVTVVAAGVVLSLLGGLLADGGHAHATPGAHPAMAGMGVLEHALHVGADLAPLVVLAAVTVQVAGAAGRASTDTLRRALRAGPARFGRLSVGWASTFSLLAGGMLVALPATSGSAAIVPAVPACTAETAVRSYDVAAVRAFIPFSRWANDSGEAAVDPVTGTQQLTDGDADGMLFALEQDVAAVQHWHVPLAADPADDPAGNRRLRPRPLVLRANVGDCLEITLRNGLLDTPGAGMGPWLPQVDPHVSLQAFGVSYNPQTSEGSSLGHNADSTVAPGQTHTYYWVAPQSSGLYLFRDQGMPAGADADGGGAEHGLYGGLAVQPAGARWFDPVSGAELSSTTPDQQYASVARQNGDLYVDAVITVPTEGSFLRYRESVLVSQDLLPMRRPGPEAEPLFERFSINYGSEPEIKRATWNKEGDVWCEECVSEETVLSSWVYGDPGLVKLASGTGPWLPTEPEWEDVDPATVAGGLPAENIEDCGLTLATDDDTPTSCYVANVTRAYQGDPIKLRFGQAGVYETHVFHLHAHTWPAEPDELGPAQSNPPRPTSAAQPRATTIDSQTYSPWTAFTADLNYGAGARAGTVGDSIYHCHLYTHFSWGFWALMRVHDTYEDGTGALPDGTRVTRWLALAEISPDQPAHPRVPPAKNAPTPENPGYPRFIPGEYGSRAPQPPLGVWQREFTEDGSVVLDEAGDPVDAPVVRSVGTTPLDPALLEATQEVAVVDPGADLTLGFAGSESPPLAPDASAEEVRAALEALETVQAVAVTGEAGGPWTVQLGLWTATPDLTLGGTNVAVTASEGFDPADPVVARTAHRLALEQQVTRAYHDPDYVFGAELDPDAQPLPGAPVVDPCVPGAREVTYRASVIQLPLTYVDGDQANPQGWRDVQGRIIVADADVDAVLAGEIEPEPFFFRVNAGDCINFELTNRTPNWIGDDAYQELVATNMVGAHIHLVNFDVLASDGSSNGWNYQQAAFTEEQAAFTQGVLDGEIPCPEGASCVPVAPTDRDPVQQAEDARASWLSEGQTIKERWYADYELRTAFMHDHHFAGTLQNRGLFSALVVEGQGYDSRDPLTGEFLQPVNTEGRGVPVCGTSCVGTAHGSAMDLIGPAGQDDFREFGVAIADFIPVFQRSATHADILDRANAVEPPLVPLEAARNDQGGMGINYRSAPMLLRQFAGPGPGPVTDPQAPPPTRAELRAAGWVDPAYTFSSRIWGDPETPVLMANRGDNVRFRLIQGSHEEMHNFTVHGVRWRRDALDPASPYINARHIGVSEAFNISDVGVDCGLGGDVVCPTPPLGNQPRVSDFLYGGTGLEDLWLGAWGVMRVFDQTTANPLTPLPDNPVGLVTGYPLPAPDPAAHIPRAQQPLPPACPTGAPQKYFQVSAIDSEIVYNRYGDHDPYGLAYVLSADVAAVRSGEKELEPLVLRANEGDCVIVSLTNEVDWERFDEHGLRGTLDGDAPITLEPAFPVPPDDEGDGEFTPGRPWYAGTRVSLHPSLVRYDVRTSDGTTVGYNFDQTAGPGDTVQYVWYADQVTYQDPAREPALTDGELGAVPLTAFGDVRGHRHHGLLAGLVVGPPNAVYRDPMTGERVTSGAQVDVLPGREGADYRDAVLIHHNGLNLRSADGTVLHDPIPDDWPDAGERAVSYRNAPLHHRLGLPGPVTDEVADPPRDPQGAPFTDPDFGARLANVFSTTYPVDGEPIGDPDTPIIRAHQGDPLRIHVLHAADRARTVAYSLGGHSWLEHAFDADSVRQGVAGSLATGGSATLHVEAAGGLLQSVGDFRYGVANGTMGLSSGSWGVLRVHQQPAPGTERFPVPLERCPSPYMSCSPLRVINEALTPVPGAPVMELTPDPLVVESLPDEVTVTAALSVDGRPLGSGHQVSLTAPEPNAFSTTVTTGGDGTVEVTVPVTAYPGRGVLEISATSTVTMSDPDGGTVTHPLADMAQVLVLDADDVTGPTVTAVEPADGAEDVPRNGAVILTFSERVELGGLADQVRLVDVDSGDPVPATVVEDHSLDVAVSTVVLDPEDRLARTSGYRVEVDASVTDLRGNAAGTPFSSVFTTAGVVVDRLEGPNRYGTAAAVSASRFEPGVETVFVASGTTFPDALAGGPAAARAQAPLLLTTPSTVPAATTAELSRLAPQHIVVLGGTAAVDGAVLEELRAFVPEGTGTVTRLAGANRYATAAAISAATFAPGVDTVVLASGAGFPDALAGSAPAARDGSPMLLTQVDGLPSDTAAELARLQPARVVVLGGSAAVGDAVLDQIATAAGVQPERVAGANRYATAAAVAEAFYPRADRAFLATGLDFPDALAAGPVAGLDGAPVLLTTPTALPQVVQDELVRLDPLRVTVLGGPAAVGGAVPTAVEALLQ